MLIASGIRTFIDLTFETDELEPYDPHPAISPESGRSPPDSGCPSRIRGRSWSGAVTSGSRSSRGDVRTVTTALRGEALAYWDTAADRWVVEPDRVRVRVGASSADLRLESTLQLVER